jgi:nicotinamidase/pyrazinamidase
MKSFQPSTGYWSSAGYQWRPWIGIPPSTAPSNRMAAPKIQLVITKGSHPEQEAYSGFHDTELARILRDKGVKRVVVCGIATDYCVQATAHDAIQEGFEVLVLEDVIRGVEVNPGDCRRAIEELHQAGAKVIVSSDLSFG